MAMDQSALLELFDAVKAAGADDVVRSAVETVLQALIDAEATALIGAAARAPRPVPRSATGSARLLTTTAGDVELRIPKLRPGRFFPSMLERRRRIDQALFAVVMEAYVTGASTRTVDDLVVARHRRLQERSQPDLRRARRGAGRVPGPPLDGTAFPYMFLDATYCKARVGGTAAAVAAGLRAAVVIATGITPTATRSPRRRRRRLRIRRVLDRLPALPAGPRACRRAAGDLATTPA